MGCWLDILVALQVQQKKLQGGYPSNKVSDFVTKNLHFALFSAIFSAVVTHVHGWLHLQFLLCAGDVIIFLKKCCFKIYYKHALTSCQLFMICYECLTKCCDSFPAVYSYGTFGDVFSLITFLWQALLIILKAFSLLSGYHL